MPRQSLFLAKCLGFLALILAPLLALASEEVDLTRLPIGDGKISGSPEVGSVWSCASQFRIPGPNSKVGDWFRNDGTFDLFAKPEVAGEVYWPSELTITLEGDFRVVSGNLLPDTPTGEFPIGRTTEAYQYDTNPNAIKAQEIQVMLPRVPEFAAEPSCLDMGAIGVMLTGASFFNSLDAAGLDAVAHEIQDGCQGHPQGAGIYHYHSLSLCQESNQAGEGHSPLVGYAFDGFGIYGHQGEGGKVLTNADLDACHGHTHQIEWDGETRELYHYHATWEYPYTIGCFMGTPRVERPTGQRQRNQSGR